MTVSLIEHAVAMDTDHIPGRGGYALVSASAGVTQGERRFLADNLGISDYLHARDNARMYFSFFRLPQGRYAFVRRYASGTRRNGVQNRLFVHSLLLDDDVFDATHGLPWILADLSVREHGSGSQKDWTSLAKIVDPEQYAPEIPPLEWRPPSVEEVHASLLRRMEALKQLSASSTELAGIEPEESVARALAAMARSSRLLLPQGPVFELLTLLAWSMLPVRDRWLLGWTQHDNGRTGSLFDFANVPQQQSGQIATDSTIVARRTVAINVVTLATWAEFDGMTRQYEQLRWHAPDLHSWLEYRHSLHTLISDPTAPEEELLPLLRQVADSVRLDRRDPWVEELTILQFVWTNILGAIGRGTPTGAAVDAWASLGVKSGIGRVIFREAPSQAWLDASETQVGADLLIHFFLRGTSSFTSAVETREALASWVLRRTRSGMRIGTDPLARLTVALAVDGSALLSDLVALLLGRADAFQALRSAIPTDRSGFGSIVSKVMLAGIRGKHRDIGYFAKEVFLPQLQQAPTLARELAEDDALAIAEELRSDPAGFVRFSFLLPDESLTKVVLLAEGWLARDGRTWRPLARALLPRAQEERRAVIAFSGLAFTAAEQQEASEVWLPVILDAADALDRSAQLAVVAAFASRAKKLSAPFAANAAAAEQVLQSVREHVASGRIGKCLAALLMATRPAWPRAPRAAAETVEALVGSTFHRAAEWESAVLALLEKRHTGERELKALARFWHRLGAHDVNGVKQASIEAVGAMRGEMADEIVTAWGPRLRSMVPGANADLLIHTLRFIAASARRPRLEIEIATGEIECRIDGPETYARLDAALRIDDPKKHFRRLRELIKSGIRGVTAADRAVWLLDLYAGFCTLPTTQYVIEESLLPDAFRNLNGADWRKVVERGEQSLFVFDSFLFDIARRVGAARAEDAARLLLERCISRDRNAGIEALVAASKGHVKPPAVGAGAF